MNEEQKQAWHEAHNAELAKRTKKAKKAALFEQREIDRASKSSPYRELAKIADKDEVAAYYSSVMRDPTATYGERTSAAMMLQRLMGWEKLKVETEDKNVSDYFARLNMLGDEQVQPWQSGAIECAADDGSDK